MEGKDLGNIVGQVISQIESTKWQKIQETLCKQLRPLKKRILGHHKSPDIMRFF